MEQKDKDNNKPVIPTLKESLNKPQLKIKGVAQGGQSLIDRLKQFKKKDLAFIMAGLGVLFMAPLAEHFMMAPEQGAGDGAFQQGWGFRDGAGGLGKGSSPYEGGLNGLAPGAMAGGNGDVITPLNVRDPSALVMGPGATQQAPAGSPSASTPTPPSKSESSDWKDALANSAAGAGKAAASHANLPIPKAALSGGGLRGLGALGGGGGGGGGGGFSLPALSASNVPNKAGGNSSLGLARGNPNFKGVARGPGGGASGGFDALKKAAGAQGDIFNRSSGGAAGALDSAAKSAMGDGSAFGGAGGGAGGAGADKGPGGNASKDSKSLGESLEFLRLKAEQDHAIDLEWKLKEKAAMRIPNLEDKVLEEAVMTPFKAVTSGIADQIKNFLKGGPGQMACVDSKGSPFKLDSSSIGNGVSNCNASGSGDGATSGSNYYYCNGSGSGAICDCGTKGSVNCTDSPAGPTPGTPQSNQGTGGNPPPPGQSPGTGNGQTTNSGALTASSNGACQGLGYTITGKDEHGQTIAGLKDGEQTASQNYAQGVADVNAANATLTGDPQNPQGCAGASAQGSGETNVQTLLTRVKSVIYSGQGSAAKTDGLDPNSVLGVLDATSVATKGVLAKLTDGKSGGPFGDPDADIQKDGTKQDKRKTDADAEDKAQKTTAAPLNALDDATKKSDPGQLQPLVAKAEQDLGQVDTSLTAASGLLGDASGKNQAWNGDPSVKPGYDKIQQGIESDRSATSGQIDKFRQAYTNEKAAVDAIQNQLLGVSIDDEEGQGGAVQGNATNAKQLASDDSSGVPAAVKLAKPLGDAKDPVEGSDSYDADKAALDSARQAYTAVSNPLVKKLQSEYSAQNKLYNGDGGNTAGGTPTVDAEPDIHDAPAAPSGNIGIKGAESKFATAASFLNQVGTGGGSQTGTDPTATTPTPPTTPETPSTP